MNKLIKFLSIHILSLGIIGYANSTQQIQYEPYSGNSQIPEIDELLEYKKIKPIDINNPVVKECIEYLETYDLLNNRLLNKLMALIYGFAKQINHYCSYYVNCSNYVIMVNSEIYNLKDGIELYRCDEYDYYRNNIEPLSNNILRDENINVNGIQFRDIDVLLRNIHMLLNSNNKSYKLLKSNTAYNILHLFYYISNRFVQISHDLINAVHKKIKENKSLNENEVMETSRYIRDKIIEPCYNNIENIMHMMVNSILNIVQSGSIVNESKALGGYMENIRKFISLNVNDSFKTLLRFCKSTACENLSKISQEVFQRLKKCSEEVKIKKYDIKKISNIKTDLIPKILERTFENLQHEIRDLYIKYSDKYYDIMRNNSNNNNNDLINCYYINYIERILDTIDRKSKYYDFYKCYENLMYENNTKPQNEENFVLYYLANKKYINTILEPLYKLRTHEFVTESMLNFDYKAEMEEIIENT